MKILSKYQTLITGFAIFSMFFGAGNVIYPLTSGRFAQGQFLWAIVGFLSTSVLISFLGLLAMALFEGDYKSFFSRIGRVPGFLVTIAIMGLVGPFGAMPRIITVSYGSIQTLIPGVSLMLFSATACFLIYFMTLKQGRMLDILGYILTPILLGSLGLIIFSGLLLSQSAQTNIECSAWDAMLKGLSDGSQTMDLLAAFCFSSIVFKIINEGGENSTDTQAKLTYKKTLKAGSVGVFLLAITYMGFITVAANHSNTLKDPQLNIEILNVLAKHVMGQGASLITSIAVSIACLTTAIALAATFSNYLYEEIFSKRISYPFLLGVCMLLTFLLSNLDFSAIVALLEPVLQLAYPALAVLSLLNIAHKLWGFEPVKVPVFLVFLSSCMWHYYI